MVARTCAVAEAAGVGVSATATAVAAVAGACAVTIAESADTLAISLFTRLRNSELNCAPGWESLLATCSILGPISFFDPMPPKVSPGFGLYTSIMRPTFPVTAGFQLSIEGCSAIMESMYFDLLATKTVLFAPRL